MRTRSLVLPSVVALVLVAASAAAQDPRTSSAQNSAAAQRTTVRGPSRGPLPDPVLLDGSTQPKEKKPEYGMLGEFEIPGDEDSKSGKVGGQPKPDPSVSPPGGPSANMGLPGMPSAGQGGAPTSGVPPVMPPSGGAAGGPSSPSEPPHGAKSGGPGGPAGGPNDPNAKAEGIQVAELKTDESAGAAGQNGVEVPVSKPQPVTIGDPTMQIKPAPNAPGVVGAQTTAGATQQMEKATAGGAGKGAPGENTNRGVEKGRVMPAGL